jgi:1-acyl-sn-glycerol-3-phosphate acyltransferase
VSPALAFLRATVVAGWVFLYVFTGGALTVLHALWTGRIERLYRGAAWCVRVGLWMAGVRVDLRGGEYLLPGQQCIYMANHQSNVDPPILFVVLPERIAMMGKKQLWSIPVLGTALRLADFIPVHREVKEEARASVEEALATMSRSGVSLLVYPEGTRSYDGRLLPFKRGVFLLAIRSGLPIVPVTLDGATEVMPKGRWGIYPGIVRVTVHPAVLTQDLGEEDRHALAEEIRRIVASALPEGMGESVASPSAVSEFSPPG